MPHMFFVAIIIIIIIYIVSRSSSATSWLAGYMSNDAVEMEISIFATNKQEGRNNNDFESESTSKRERKSVKKHVKYVCVHQYWFVSHWQMTDEIMAYVRNFFCINLRSATILIAWIDIILSMLLVSLCFYVLMMTFDYVENRYHGQYSIYSEDSQKPRIQMISFGKHKCSNFDLKLFLIKLVPICPAYIILQLVVASSDVSLLLGVSTVGARV